MFSNSIAAIYRSGKLSLQTLAQRRWQNTTKIPPRDRRNLPGKGPIPATTRKYPQFRAFVEDKLEKSQEHQVCWQSITRFYIFGAGVGARE